MHVKVILNPWSDRGRAKERATEIEQAAQSFGGVELALTKRPGEARLLAQEAAANGFDLVVAAGGDGTVHEVVNGLMQGGASSAMLGVIPIGSGNDFAYAMGIPTDIETAVSHLFTGKNRTIDLARVEDDRGRFAFFDNNLGIGFDAIVVIETGNITRVHGFLMYLVAVLRTIAFYFQTPRLKIQFDDERVEQESLFLALGVGPRGGGGFFLTPDAKHDDDLIDSCLVNPVGRLTMLSMLGQAIKGTHINSRHVSMRQSKRIHVKANMPLPIHIDGEVFAYPKDNVQGITVTSLPAALQVRI